MKLIFLCSGEGVRMRPLSDSYPKSLIPVHHAFDRDLIVPNIQNSVDVILRSQVGSQIEEIFIVAPSGRHYFDREDYLKFKETCKLSIREVVTPVSSWNNWYSMKLALSVILGSENCQSIMVVEGDVYLKSSLVDYLPFMSSLCKKSYYCCSYRENEWVFVNRHESDYFDVVKGGNGLAMSGLSVINGFNTINRLFETLCSVRDYSEFWDDSLIRLKLPLNLIDVEGSIVEFDSISDLIKNGLFSQEEVASLLSDNGSFERTSSMTNNSFVIERNGFSSVLRLPGSGTEKFINRDRERSVQELVNKTGLTPRSSIYNGGVKITDFVESCRTSEERDAALVVELIGKFHQIDFTVSEVLVNLIDEIEDYEEMYSTLDLVTTPDDYTTISSIYKSLIQTHQHREVVLCHRDLDPRNILIKEDGSTYLGYLIDFEYSGALNRYWDYGAHLSEMKLHFASKMTEEEYCHLVRETSGEVLDPDKLLLWRGIVDFVWSCWTLSKISLGEDYKEYFNERWKASCEVLRKIGMIQ